jgi:hypothetical protein
MSVVQPAADGVFVHSHQFDIHADAAVGAIAAQT